MQMVTGKIHTVQKVCIYGPEGIGKSTFAACFPQAVFIDTEGGTKELDVIRTPRPSSWTMLMQQVSHFILNPSDLETLVIDTADWAEKLCIEDICAKKEKKSIEDFGYGKGYTELAEEFGRLLNRLTELIDKGVNVVLVAHAQIKKFELPNESGAYDRWELKLEKKTAALVKEWVDMLLFANYKTIVVKSEDKKNKAVGGQRMMYTSHNPSWDAKNRKGLEDELPLEFMAIAHCFPKIDIGAAANVSYNMDAQKWANENATKAREAEKAADPAAAPAPAPAATAAAAPPPSDNTGYVEPSGAAGQSVPFDDYSGVPKALADLMMSNNVSVQEIQKAVAYKEYYPIDTPIGNYDAAFVNGVLIGAWGQVLDLVQKMREDKPY